MTQEEKAKAYDEALERAKVFKEHLLEINDKGYADEMKYIFPELAESEDEKMMNQLHSWMKEFGGAEEYTEKVYNWLKGLLEKQGEQEEPQVYETKDREVITYSETDGYKIIKPKFHEGDWIVSNLDKKVRQISEVHFDEYNSYYVVNGKSVNLEEYDRLHHLWSIEDAKDSDVLQLGLVTAIFKEYMGTYCICHCSFCKAEGFERPIANGIDNNYGCHNATPATKEQCDLLFSKMKEARYEWDAEKKELKKIEDEEYNCEDYGIDGLWHAKNILEKTLRKVSGYQTDDGILSHQCAITALKKLYKQKPTWSEEDENVLKDIEEAIINYWHGDTQDILLD